MVNLRRSKNDEAAAAGQFSNQVHHALSQLSSKFGANMNQAFATVPATKERARDFDKKQLRHTWSPLARWRKRQVMKQNQEAIDRDMKILHQTKAQGIVAQDAKFEGFAKLGQDDYVENLFNELDDSDFDSDSDDESESDSDDDDDDSGSDESSEGSSDGPAKTRKPLVASESSAVQQLVHQAQQQISAPQQTRTTPTSPSSSKVSESEEESCSSEYDSESESDSDYDSEFDGSSYYDSDDESISDLMTEIENEMGFVLPEALLEEKMSAGGNNKMMQDETMYHSSRSVTSSNMSMDSYVVSSRNS